MNSINNYMATCGGNIQCRRCLAKSKRTGLQCGRPALSSSKTQKCEFHGGRSTGPKTAEGKAKIAAGAFKTGNYTQAAVQARSHNSAYMLRLEDAMHHLDMASGTRTRGRKPNFYTPVRSVDEIPALAKEATITLAGSLAKGG
jgi:hypothetical protein